MTVDISAAFDGLDASTLEAINKPEVLERLSAFVEKSKEPVLSKNSEVLGKFTTLKEQVDALGGFDAIKALKESADAAQKEKQEALVKSGNVDAMRAQYEASLAEKTAELTKLQQSMVKDRTGSAIAKALREADGDSDLLFPHLQSRIRSELIEGKVVLTPLDVDGAPLITKDMKQGTIKDLITEMQGKHPSAFKTKVVTGSGAQSAGASAAGIKNPFMPATLNFMEQNRIARDDPKLAMSLAALAGRNLKL